MQVKVMLVRVDGVIYATGLTFTYTPEPGVSSPNHAHTHDKNNTHCNDTNYFSNADCNNQNDTDDIQYNGDISDQNNNKKNKNNTNNKPLNEYQCAGSEDDYSSDGILNRNINFENEDGGENRYLLDTNVINSYSNANIFDSSISQQET